MSMLWQKGQTQLKGVLEMKRVAGEGLSQAGIQQVNSKPAPDFGGRIFSARLARVC